MRQIVHLGLGALRMLNKVLESFRSDSIFLVAGKGSFEISGARHALERALAGREVVQFRDFDPNPRLEDIERGIAVFTQSGCQLILAIGGGSAIDVAKLIGLLSSQRVPPIHIIKKKLAPENNAPAIIAVPTTAGSGSEATSFAVVYIAHSKYSVVHPSLLPAAAIVDPELTFSLPPSITAVTGLDALSQAIESIWSIHSTEESRSYAAQAIPLIMRNLREAVHSPKAESRMAMSRAAHLAGRAINISRTTAPHAISYIMTARFGIPHGHAVALTLPQILMFNSEVTENSLADARGIRHVSAVMDEIDKLLGCRNAAESAHLLVNFMEAVNLSATLGKCGIRSKSNRDIIVNNVNVERLANNPRTITRNDLVAILEKTA